MFDELIILGIVILSFLICHVPMVRASSILTGLLHDPFLTAERTQRQLKKSVRLMNIGWVVCGVLSIGGIVCNFFWPVVLGAMGAGFIGFGYVCDFGDDLFALRQKVSEST